MNSYDSIIYRIEVRNFAKTQNVVEEQIKKVIEAGRLAPSARNQQPWKFMIIKDPDKLKRLSDFNSNARYIKNAGFAVGVFIKKTKFGEIDATRAITQMQIVAWLLNPKLGSCFTWGWIKEQVEQILGQVEDYQLFTIIPFGFPQNPNVIGKKNRKNWNEIII